MIGHIGLCNFDVPSLAKVRVRAWVLMMLILHCFRSHTAALNHDPTACGTDTLPNSSPLIPTAGVPPPSGGPKNNNKKNRDSLHDRACSAEVGA